nr:heavy metal-associated isoprenylated plant protein 45 [Ipomoea batatas]
MYFGWFKKTRRSDALSIVELLVRMDCDGCQERVRRAISKLEGVDSMEIDMDRQKVTVKGYVEGRRVLKAVRRGGSRAELWPFPDDGEYFPYAAQYLDESNFAPTYNYYTHGYNESMRGYYPTLPYSTLVDDNVAFSFSDDNVHACIVM